MKPSSLVLSGLAIVGLGSLIYGRESLLVERVKGLLLTKLPGVEPSVFNDAPISLTPQQRATHEFGLAALVPAIKAELGRTGTPYETQMCAAVAHAETSYGKGWKGAMAASNNWGAVQCPKNAQDGPGCIAYGDSFSTGQKYSVSFRSYASPVDGARDTVKHVLIHRKKVAEALASDGASVFRAALTLRRKSYYGGFCPKATSRYGASAIVQKENLNPTSEAGKACEREAVEVAAKTYNKTVQAIAAITGEKALPLGTFEDALDWYSESVQAPIAGTPRGVPAGRGGLPSSEGYDGVAGFVGGIVSVFDDATNARERFAW